MKRPTRAANGIASLATQLEQLGFSPGVPKVTALESVGCDAAAWASEQCPECGRFGLAVLPLQNGTRYSLLVVCPQCGNQVEG